MAAQIYIDMISHLLAPYSTAVTGPKTPRLRLWILRVCFHKLKNMLGTIDQGTRTPLTQIWLLPSSALILTIDYAQQIIFF